MLLYFFISICLMRVHSLVEWPEDCLAGMINVLYEQIKAICDIKQLWLVDAAKL